MTAETLRGSCHCGAVLFSACIDLGETTLRCNCSICTKSRNWIAPIPECDFSLLSGEGVLSAYKFGERKITHYFCSRCGIRTHGRISNDDGADLSAWS